MINIDKIKNITNFQELTQKDNSYLTFIKTKIASHITPKLAQYMLDFSLAPNISQQIFETIKTQHFHNLSSCNTPTMHLIIGQTGAGKSLLSQTLLQNNPNTIHLDTDLYKHYNPLSPHILQYAPTYYGHLTAIDSYLHRDQLFNYALTHKYNILLEIAPSSTHPFCNLDFNKILSQNYQIHLHILAVSLPNSLLSIHERYERQILQISAFPKLTDLQRAIQSHSTMPQFIKYLQTLPIKQSTLYSRYQNPTPSEYNIHNNISQKTNTSNTQAILNNKLQFSKQYPTKEAQANTNNKQQISKEYPTKKTQANTNNKLQISKDKAFYNNSTTSNYLIQNQQFVATKISSKNLLNEYYKLQNTDLIQTAPTYIDRIKTIQQQMSNRHAPLAQINQLNQIIEIIKSTPLPLVDQH